MSHCENDLKGGQGEKPRLYIGTSGFSYKDWVGPFYPPGTSQGDMLDYYAGQFGAVELNFTYYRMPDPASLHRLTRKANGRLIFAVKANQEMTHSAGRPPEEAFRSFNLALRPLVEDGTVGCILAQFPWSFKNSAKNRASLFAFREKMGDLPVAVEFRNAAWIVDAAFSMLKELDFGYCCVDEPRLKGLIPPVVAATSSIGYVRFHGRNTAKWWRHEHAYERYAYLYSEEELREWVPRIKALQDQTSTVFVFFNNHFRGYAVKNARALAKLMGEA